MSVRTDLPAYDVVMATRNRTDAVALSLPLLLGQSHPPARVIVVDSSDDPAPIAALVDDAAAGTATPVERLRADPGLTHQRNVGLTRCEAEIVLFPDDDSLLYPDAAERIMEVYAADTGGVIAGVAGQSVDTPPDAVADRLGTFTAEETGRAGRAIRDIRQRVKEATGGLNPFVATGNRLNAAHPTPAFLADHGAVSVPYMTGFRMSFRRAAIAPTGFDETLIRYSWFEDIDASYTAMQSGRVVTATRAGIYHHRAAGARDNGHLMGLWAILNRTYVVMKAVRTNPKVFPSQGREIRRLRAYSLARAAAYTLMARGDYGRDRARGARDGVRRQGRLTGAAAADLSETYRTLAT